MTAKLAKAVLVRMKQIPGSGRNAKTTVVPEDNGAFEVQAIKIDKAVVDPTDIGMLEDLVTAAINAAVVKMREVTKDKMAKVMGPMAGMPGMGGMF